MSLNIFGIYFSKFGIVIKKYFLKKYCIFTFPKGIKAKIFAVLL